MPISAHCFVWIRQNPIPTSCFTSFSIIPNKILQRAEDSKFYSFELLLKKKEMMVWILGWTEIICQSLAGSVLVSMGVQIFCHGISFFFFISPLMGLVTIDSSSKLLFFFYLDPLQNHSIVTSRSMHKIFSRGREVKHFDKRGWKRGNEPSALQ